MQVTAQTHNELLDAIHTPAQLYIEADAAYSQFHTQQFHSRILNSTSNTLMLTAFRTVLTKLWADGEIDACFEVSATAK